MEDLLIEATKSTPKIHFQGSESLMEISGESYPENAVSFFSSLFEWVEAFLRRPVTDPIRLTVSLTYFNSSSSRALLDLFDLLDAAATSDRDVVIEWRYDAENDMAKEYGEEFLEEVERVDFRLIEN